MPELINGVLGFVLVQENLEKKDFVYIAWRHMNYYQATHQV